MAGAEGRDRTGDTTIFSRVLYQLSYLGPNLNLNAGNGSPDSSATAFGRIAMSDSPGIVPGSDLVNNIPESGGRSPSCYRVGMRSQPR